MNDEVTLTLVASLESLKDAEVLISQGRYFRIDRIMSRIR